MSSHPITEVIPAPSGMTEGQRWSLLTFTTATPGVLAVGLKWIEGGPEESLTAFRVLDQNYANEKGLSLKSDARRFRWALGSVKHCLEASDLYNAGNITTAQVAPEFFDLYGTDIIDPYNQVEEPSTDLPITSNSIRVTKYGEVATPATTNDVENDVSFFDSQWVKDSYIQTLSARSYTNVAKEGSYAVLRHTQPVVPFRGTGRLVTAIGPFPQGSSRFYLLPFDDQVKRLGRYPQVTYGKNSAGTGTVDRWFSDLGIGSPMDRTASMAITKMSSLNSEASVRITFERGVEMEPEVGSPYMSFATMGAYPDIEAMEALCRAFYEMPDAFPEEYNFLGTAGSLLATLGPMVVQNLPALIKGAIDVFRHVKAAHQTAKPAITAVKKATKAAKKK